MATFLLSLAILAAYGLEQALGANGVCHMWGLVPAHPSFGSAVSSMFLHDGFSHLAGNLVFLAVFGTVVESELGSFKFLALFAAAGLGGVVMHIFIDPSSTTPLVGCSGALFGLMAVAAALRPRFLGFAVAFVAVTVWQAFTGGDENVSFACHLGGFVVGAMAAVGMHLNRTVEA